MRIVLLRIWFQKIDLIGSVSETLLAESDLWPETRRWPPPPVWVLLYSFDGFIWKRHVVFVSKHDNHSLPQCSNILITVVIDVRWKAALLWCRAESEWEGPGEGRVLPPAAVPGHRRRVRPLLRHLQVSCLHCHCSTVFMVFVMNLISTGTPSWEDWDSNCRLWTLVNKIPFKIYLWNSRNVCFLGTETRIQIGNTGFNTRTC
jgi:hypothetical protein